MNERQKAFVLELTELTKRHGIAIGGCGCCGSPYLVDCSKEFPEAGYAVTKDGDDITWVSPDNESRWKDSHTRIVNKKTRTEE